MVTTILNHYRNALEILALRRVSTMETVVPREAEAISACWARRNSSMA
ncbi:MAG: hypothetical protein XD51_0754 [Moorella sp. 60_41]|nr:MAG: hypothetical protein XD51_0754 [Moorella sp. 60_41]